MDTSYVPQEADELVKKLNDSLPYSHGLKIFFGVLKRRNLLILDRVFDGFRFRQFAQTCKTDLAAHKVEQAKDGSRSKINQVQNYSDRRGILFFDPQKNETSSSRRVKGAGSTTRCWNCGANHRKPENKK